MAKLVRKWPTVNCYFKLCTRDAMIVMTYMIHHDIKFHDLFYVVIYRKPLMTHTVKVMSKNLKIVTKH